MDFYNNIDEEKRKELISIFNNLQITQENKRKDLINIFNEFQKIEDTKHEELRKNIPQIIEIMSDVRKNNIFETIKYYEESKFNEFKYKQYVIELWNEFEDEIKYKNRFSPEANFVKVFSKLAQKADYKLNKDTILFRARKIDEKQLHPIVKSFIDRVKEYFNDYNTQKILENCNDIWDYIINLPIDEWNDKFAKISSSNEIVKWGFQEDDSDAPPNDKCIPGRANPLGIRYLYTSDDITTAISETQPTIGQIISVAKIQTKIEMKIFDFDFYNTFSYSEIMKININELEEIIGMSFTEFAIFFRIVEQQFTKPSLNDIEYYHATQYITEIIKKMGFEGIRFKSSLNTGGNNIVIFDTSKDKLGVYPKNYEILGTSLHKIKDIKVTSNIILPKNENKENR